MEPYFILSELVFFLILNSRNYYILLSQYIPSTHQTIQPKAGPSSRLRPAYTQRILKFLSAFLEKPKNALYFLLFLYYFSENYNPVFTLAIGNEHSDDHHILYALLPSQHINCRH